MHCSGECIMSSGHATFNHSSLYQTSRCLFPESVQRRHGFCQRCIYRYSQHSCFGFRFLSSSYTDVHVQMTSMLHSLRSSNQFRLSFLISRLSISIWIGPHCHSRRALLQSHRFVFGHPVSGGLRKFNNFHIDPACAILRYCLHGVAIRHPDGFVR